MTKVFSWLPWKLPGRGRRPVLTGLDNLVIDRETGNMATVVLTAQAEKEAERLPEVIVERIRKLIHRLEAWPEVSGAKALSGNLAGWYRMRTGDYRLRFRVEGETIMVDKIGHRRDFYED